VARRHDLVVIEDCAQAHGASLGGRSAGAFGAAAAFSFYPTKNLGAAGDAGAVVARDPAVAERARILAQYGWRPRPQIAVAGGRNSRLDPVQAAFLSARLPFLDAHNRRRREIAARYRRAAPALRFLGDPDLTVAHHAVVVTDHRSALQRHLNDNGISSAIHYPLVIGEMAGLRLAHDARTTPTAQRLASRVVSVPCAPELTDEEVDRVAHALAGWTEAS
jgi:dTDP-4-amino-4,6-dideoxygalactose transaminase